jgi:hypothetical protein
MSNFVESLMLQIPRSHLHIARGGEVPFQPQKQE